MPLSSQPLATVAVGQEPDGITVDDYHGLVFVANRRDGTVTVLNDVTYATVATIAVGGAPGAIIASHDTHHVFVADEASNTIHVLSSLTFQVLRSYPVGRGPHQLALNQRADLLYVTNGADNTLTAIDSANRRVLETVTVPAHPVSVTCYNGNYEVYVASFSVQPHPVSTISDFDGERLRLLHRQTVANGPVTMQTYYDIYRPELNLTRISYHLERGQLFSLIR